MIFSNTLSWQICLSLLDIRKEQCSQHISPSWRKLGAPLQSRDNKKAFKVLRDKLIAFLIPALPNGSGTIAAGMIKYQIAPNEKKFTMNILYFAIEPLSAMVIVRNAHSVSLSA